MIYEISELDMFLIDRIYIIYISLLSSSTNYLVKDFIPGWIYRLK